MDFVERRLTVVRRMLKADEGSRQVGRRIIIRLERGAKVVHYQSFSIES